MFANLSQPAKSQSNVPRKQQDSILLDANCASCLPDGFCGVMPMTPDTVLLSSRKKRYENPHRHRVNEKMRDNSITSSQAQSSVNFPNKLPSLGSSSTNDTHMITSRIPFFWRSHPNIRKHQRSGYSGNVTTLFEQDRVRAFDEAQILYSAERMYSLTSRPSDEISSKQVDTNRNSYESKSFGHTQLKEEESTAPQQQNHANSYDESVSESESETEIDSESEDDKTQQDKFSDSNAISVEDATKQNSVRNPTSLSSSSLSSTNKTLTPNSSSTVLDSQKQAVRSKSPTQKETSEKTDIWLTSMDEKANEMSKENIIASNSFVDDFVPQLHLFPEFKEHNTSSEMKETLELTPIPSSSNDWVSFPEFPK